METWQETQQWRLASAARRRREAELIRAEAAVESADRALRARNATRGWRPEATRIQVNFLETLELHKAGKASVKQLALAKFWVGFEMEALNGGLDHYKKEGGTDAKSTVGDSGV